MINPVLLTKVTCQVCEGNGRGRNYDTWDCPQCYGTGSVFVEVPLLTLMQQMANDTDSRDELSALGIKLSD